ncbi:MAG: glycerophosphodiester phosphodiesterase family protein [Deltaproteobacteria bacterium]|jgi:glycerophosphoryl diester phosphodiesterase
MKRPFFHQILSKKLLLFIVLICVFGPSSFASSLRKTVWVVGHRGIAGLAPENTLAGFSRALQMGVDAVELDVLMTADNHLVVYHDFYLNPNITRTAAGQWLEGRRGPEIKKLSLAAIQTYDIGRPNPLTSYARKHPDLEPVDGQRIPTLKDVIRLFKTKAPDHTQLWIEIKTTPEHPEISPEPERISALLVRLLKAEGFLNRAKILSFDWRCLAHVQQIEPKLQTVYLTSLSKQFKSLSFDGPWKSAWTSPFDIHAHGDSIPRTIQAAGGTFWAPKYTQVTPALIHEAHALGLAIAVWTPDEIKQFRQLIGMGVDAVITNRPDRLVKLIHKN